MRLLAGLLEQPLRLAEDQRALLERAGGNPLFAEQYSRMLGERGTTAEVPESVQALIASRLDALPQAEKRLVQEAAVHGKVFWIGGVAAAGGMAASEADRYVRALERKDFVRRERASTVRETRSTPSATPSFGTSPTARSLVANERRSTAARAGGSRSSDDPTTTLTCSHTITSRRSR